MKYSVIIPALNEEKLLPDLLENFQDPQLKKDFDYELIVSDGGSSDKTIELAKKYTDKVVLANQNEKQNIAKGRNSGADKAIGDILIFINADVAIDNVYNLFSAIREKLKDEKYLAMTCKVLINKEEEIFSDKIFLGFYNFYFHLLNVIGVGMGRGECHIIRRKVFEESGGYNVNFAAGEDFDLFRRIRKLGKIYFSRKNIIYESPRRYREIGHFGTMFKWLANSVSTLFLKQSISKEWKQVR